MKVFHCHHCRHLVFFENVQCVKCESKLGYLPDLGLLGSLDPAGEGVWSSPLPRADGKTYRLCRNYSLENVCNWTVEADDPNPLCVSCRLTQVIPDLDAPENRGAWYRLEVAKRRLVYSLLCLGLPLMGKAEQPETGLMFKFMADSDHSDQPPVLTGHAQGVITVNIAEADDAEREKRRQQMNEPYRTLLGHFRHEVGHYYWDRLINDSDWAERFRERFGDERQDYAVALERHHQQGPPVDWQDRFVSAYASAHPWEDWAETWAHYLHMADTLETTVASGLSLRPIRADEPKLKSDLPVVGGRPSSFDDMLDNWLSVTYILNNLNRGLGLQDAYPFVLSQPAIEKLRFVDDVLGRESVPSQAQKARAR